MVEESWTFWGRYGRSFGLFLFRWGDPHSMNMEQGSSLVGRGLYSPTEASRIAGVPVRRMRRWTHGYWYHYRGDRQWSEPIVGLGLGTVGSAPVLDFADLMEVRFLNAFRNQGVGWRTIRIASERAKEILGTAHPFSSFRFTTDGTNILADVLNMTSDRQLLDLVRDQWEFERLIGTFLRKGIHYDGEDQPQYWRPLGDDRSVLLHPRRSFGAPIVTPGSVRTQILHAAYKAEGSRDEAARWYKVDRVTVDDAIEFEESLERAA